MTPYFGNAGQFLVQTLFGVYILIVMLRFLLQWVRADFYNPLSQFVVKATQPLLKPLRRYVPGYAGLDLAALLLMLVLKLVELKLLLALQGYGGALPGVLMLAVAELASLAVDVFFYAIIIQVVMSWVSPGLHNPVTGLLYSLTEPVLRPARRLIPPAGGFDLSPIAAIIALKLASMLLIAPIRDVAVSML